MSRTVLSSRLNAINDGSDVTQDGRLTVWPIRLPSRIFFKITDGLIIFLADIRISQI